MRSVYSILTLLAVTASTVLAVPKFDRKDVEEITGKSLSELQARVGE